MAAPFKPNGVATLAGSQCDGRRPLQTQGPVEVPRVAAMMGLLAHNAEMYGISSVYLRARNLVPPGSERR